MRLFSWIFLIFVHLTIDNAFGFEESEEEKSPPSSPMGFDFFPPMSPIRRQGSTHSLDDSLVIPLTPSTSRDLDLGDLGLFLETPQLRRGFSDGSTAADRSEASLDVQRSPADDSQRYEPQTRYAAPKVSKEPSPTFNDIEKKDAEDQDPHALLVIDTSTEDIPQAFDFLLPKLKLQGHDPHYSEEAMRANISTHHCFHNLQYGDTLIGPYLSHVERRLSKTVKAISQNMTGGVKTASTKNVCAYSTSIIDTSGNLSLLISDGQDSFGFLSPPTPAKPRSPGACCCLSPSGPAFREKGKNFNLIGDLDLQEKDGFTIGIKDKFLPVIFSDSDAPSDSSNDKRSSVISILNKTRRMFPLDTLAFLEEQLLFNMKDALSKATEQRALELEMQLKHLIEEIAEKKEKVELSNDITPLLSMLSDGEISKIYGHSEQVMARYFEKIVIPNLYRRHLMVKGADTAHGIAEVIFHIATLQDCCWWCARTLSALSGPKIFDDGTVINLRFLVTSFKSFPTRSIDTTRSVQFHDSRKELSAQRELDLKALPPILFNFSTIDTEASSETTAATGTAWTLDPRFEIIKSPAGFPVISLKTRI